MDESKLEINLFGAPAVAGDVLTGKHALLLAHLLLDDRGWIAKDELIARLWPESDAGPRRAKHALSNLLSDLGAKLGPALVREGPRVKLDRSGVALDTARVRELMEHARAALADGRWGAAIDEARAVVDLARPGLMCGEEAEWLEPHRRAYDGTVCRALELAVKAALSLGGTWPEKAWADADALCKREYESGYRLKMLIALAGGDHADAARVDADLEQMLRKDGLRPSDATRDVRAQLYAEGDGPAEQADARPATDVREPPPGGPPGGRLALVPFDPDARSEYFCRLALRYGPLVGQPHVRAQIARVTDEIANIGWAVCFALERDRPIGVLAAIALKDHCWYRSFSIEVIAELALARSSGHPMHGQVVNLAGLNAIARGDLKTARKLYEYGLAFALQTLDHPVEALCNLGLAELALRQFAYDLAPKLFQEAHRGFGALRDELGQANCLLGLGLVSLWRRDLDGACRDLGAAFGLYDGAEDRLGAANCTRALGEAAMARSEYASARERFEHALAAYVDIGHLLGQASARRDLAALALRAGDVDHADKQLHVALRIQGRIGNTLGRANCHVDLGDVELARARPAQAGEHFEQSRSLYRERGCVRGQVDVANRLAALALERADADGARRELERALALGREPADPYSLARTHVYLGRLDDRSAESHIADARQALASIGHDDLARSLAPGCDAPPPRRIPDDNA